MAGAAAAAAAGAAAGAAAAGGPALDWASQLWFAFLDRVPLSERVLFVVRGMGGLVGWLGLDGVGGGYDATHAHFTPPHAPQGHMHIYVWAIRFGLTAVPQLNRNN